MKRPLQSWLDAAGLTRQMIKQWTHYNSQSWIVWTLKLGIADHHDRPQYYLTDVKMHFVSAIQVHSKITYIVNRPDDDIISTLMLTLVVWKHFSCAVDPKHMNSVLSEFRSRHRAAHQHVVPFPHAVKTLDLTIDCHLSFDKHVQNMRKLAYYHICTIQHM